MKALSHLWDSIQTWLLPELEQELGELTHKLREFVRVCELCELERFMMPYHWSGRGRPRSHRLAIAKAFVAKSVYNSCSTRALLDQIHASSPLRRLCGWETINQVPSESTFSRAFSSFADGKLPQRIHEAMIQKHHGDKLVGHLSRDSAAVEAPEKPVYRPPKAPKKRFPRGRPKKGQKRPPAPARRLPLQGKRTLAENLADLPNVCDSGGKLNSKGKPVYWRGYKLHIDVADGDVPISAIITSASTHDSQAAIPLAQMSAQRVTNLYDLMDAAYDAGEIRKYSEQLGHVAIIDHNSKGRKKIEFDPAEARRFRERTSAERVFSLLDYHGRKTVRVRGASKVMAHLMFGLLTITTKKMFNMLS